jgi:simple sugar transport system substrate-binding protein
MMHIKSGGNMAGRSIRVRLRAGASRTAWVLLLVAAAAPSRSAWSRTINIIVVTHGQAADPFWSIVKRGATDAGRAADVSVSYRAPDTFDMTQMGNLIRAAAAQKPDGLVVSLPDVSALGPAVRQAAASGIPVITINAGSASSKELGALLHVGQGEYEAGHVAGIRLAAKGGHKGICLNQEVGNVSLDQFCKGFSDGFKGPVQVVPVSTDPAETTSKVGAALRSDPALDTIFSLNAAVTGEAAADAAGKAGRNTPVHIGAINMSAGFLKDIETGHADLSVDQQPYLQGYLPVVFLALHARYGLIPAGGVSTGPALVEKAQAPQVMELSAQGIR